MPLSVARPAPAASSTRGATPMPTTHEVALDNAPGGGAYAPHRTLALESLDALAEHELDAVVAMHVTVEGADLGAEDALQRQRGSDR